MNGRAIPGAKMNTFRLTNVTPELIIFVSRGITVQNYNFGCCSCGCETWSVTLREEQKLRVFENGMLGKILGHKRDEVTGEFRRLHIVELYDLYSSPTLFG